jgi:hypothetical protein
MLFLFGLADEALFMSNEPGCQWKSDCGLDDEFERPIGHFVIN